MLRKILPIILVLFLLVGLFGCGGDSESPDTSLTPNPEIGQEEPAVEDYKLLFEGVDVSPGQPFSADTIEREAIISRMPSSAFAHYVSAYNYDDLLQLSVTEIDGVETIYFVHILDAEISTPNGVRLGDSVERVYELYRENYEEVGIRKIYVIGDIEVSFFINDGVVVDIELWIYGLLV